MPTLPDGRDGVATVNKESFLLGSGTRPEPSHPSAVVLVAEDGPTHANVKIYEELVYGIAEDRFIEQGSCIVCTLPSWSS